LRYLLPSAAGTGNTEIGFMDMRTRREPLATITSPGNRVDFVVSLSGRVAHPLHPAPLAVAIRYVPDKWILSPAAFLGYLKNLETPELTSLEAVGVAVLDDINNEVVPRWVQVAVRCAADGSGGHETHGVLLEDRQPRWDNPALLSRLGAI